jgi:hypothetical protein
MAGRFLRERRAKTLLFLRFDVLVGAISLLVFLFRKDARLFSLPALLFSLKEMPFSKRAMRLFHQVFRFSDGGKPFSRLVKRFSE